METRQGKSVFSGVAIGKLFIYKKAKQVVEKITIEDPAAEVARYMAAKAKAKEQLEMLKEKTMKDVGEAEAEIFEAHQMLLEDLDFVEGITGMIENDKVNAEYAVFVTGEQCAALFLSMDDDYMRGRAADVNDISSRLIAILSGTQVSAEAMPEPVIIMAEDLAPSETVQFEKDKILALVTQKGSANSHTAILARMMNIPCIVTADIDLDPELTGKDGIVDGFTGKIYIEPDEVTTAVMTEKKKREEERKLLLQSLKGLPTVTKSGKHIHLYSNIGSEEDVDAVLANDSEGIGLFRSEFLYLSASDYPTEDEQFEAYRSVATAMNGKRVVIRTLDIGADKQVDYFDMKEEENPALGVRAIRICLNRPEVFRTQLRALYRASVYGKIAIMFPMITSVWEVKECKRACMSVMKELEAEGIPYDKDTELGIMIETPSSVFVAEELAKLADFFSVGTNDLTQYTLACDRQANDLGKFYDPHHPALLRAIKMAADAAHKAGIWIGICGELGADISMLPTFLAMGIDELSVSPSAVLPVRAAIRQSIAQTCTLEMLEC